MPKYTSLPFRLSRHYFTFPLYLPRIILLLQNWPTYLSNYLRRRRVPATYTFRSGVKLRDPAGTLAGTIAVVFLRREYGVPTNALTIVDIGANMGSFSVYSALLCPTARIIAFEPEQGNFSALSHNVTQNSLQDRVQCVRAAIASQSGNATLNVSESPLNSICSAQDSVTTQIVPSLTLKDVMEAHHLTRVDFLKINCEGAEYDILYSTPPDYLKRVGCLRLEYHASSTPNHSAESLVRFLKSSGFQIERLSRDGNISGFIWARQTLRP